MIGHCLLYTSDAADDSLRVDLGGRRIIKKNKKNLLRSKEIEKLEGKLSSHFGTKIYTSGNSNKGKIIIPYNSTNDLNRILEILDII